ncbi:hypothetical protein [Plantactinospora sp. B24E8]|uniref:hypothetical protein n=1 Tax=Plantactinospora sp. B24E8 TaxID=3153567 RepID=UPI00325E8D2B
MLPEPKVLFGQMQYEAGSEAAARQRFQMLVTELVALRHPNADEVAGPGGGDWGIDTYVGRLDETIAVWQSKFFMDWKGKDQQDQVRDSFRQLLQKAAEEGFQVDAWTLCVPCILPPKEQKWFDSWAAKNRRIHNVRSITLWNGVKLRRLLAQEDAELIRRAYLPVAAPQPPAESLALAADLAGLDAALFVRQLEEAGYVETDAARGLFFAAEALARDLAARGNRAGIGALEELHLEIQALWEQKFNSLLPMADERGRMMGLVDQVLKEAGHCPDPEGLRLRPAHRRGVAHRLVENSRAGWVRHWREVAASHKGLPAGDLVAEKLATAHAGESS